METLCIRESPFGRGVFTNIPVQNGTRLIEWKGRTLIKDLTPEERKDVSYITHIGHDEVTVKSNAIDDYVNHSCTPNCGLRFEDEGVFLYAIEDISAGAELLWDYSTTVTRRGLQIFPEWREPCTCSARNCRKVVDAFRTLPSGTKAYYRSLNIVPDFVIADDDAL